MLFEVWVSTACSPIGNACRGEEGLSTVLRNAESCSSAVVGGAQVSNPIVSACKRCGCNRGRSLTEKMFLSHL